MKRLRVQGISPEVRTNDFPNPTCPQSEQSPVKTGVAGAITRLPYRSLFSVETHIYMWENIAFLFSFEKKKNYMYVKT